MCTYTYAMRLQIHLTYFGEDAMLVSWATGEGQVGTVQLKPPPTDSVQSIVQLGTSPGSLTITVTGAAYTYAYDFNEPRQARSNYTYTSPLLHHAVATGEPACIHTIALTGTHAAAGACCSPLLAAAHSCACMPTRGLAAAVHG